ncbi:MAG: trans-4-hydroxy-L-proline dehydratase [Phycisphaerae bacterium]
MNERIKLLREQSVSAQPFICGERAELVTDFYMSSLGSGLSVPQARAKLLEYILANKTICISDGELIVGERGSAPKATPTYPEICCHTLSDLDIMNSRPRAPYAVSADVRRLYEEKIIPFWQGRTIREAVFGCVSREWTDAFEAGVFTEFMEQRSPGHAILDDKIYHKGLNDFKREIEITIDETDCDSNVCAKRDQLLAMLTAADALIAFANRYADKAAELAAAEEDPARKLELLEIERVCRKVPANKPDTFREALQMYWFVHLAVITETNPWDSYNPGRIDQHLIGFYEKELADGTLTREDAKELLECFWVKFNNHPAPPKVGITMEQSGTYTDFSLINVGGVKPDGSDAINELSFLVMEVVEQMQLTQPSSCIQISVKNPDEFVERACLVIKKGFGQPSVFNTDVIIEELLRDGKSLADARAGGPSGCVTVSAFGKEICCLTGYCNMAKVLEVTLYGGFDPGSGKQIGPKTAKLEELGSFEELLAAYKQQLEYFIDLKIDINSRIEKIYSDMLPVPFMSILVDDCISRGLDYHSGGPRYNPTYIQAVGLGSLTDALAALKYHVYDNKTISAGAMMKAVSTDFSGDEYTRLLLINKTPKYGNDEEYADSLAREAFEIYFDVLDGKPNTRGGCYRVNMLPTTSHIYFGKMTGALPSGRKAGEPLSDGISPSAGADTHGPSAVIKSAACFDHSRTGGTLLNMKFNPQVFEKKGAGYLVSLIRAYFKLGGHHIQFNVVNREELLDAQKHPEKHRDLIIRVAGYSDYFIVLGKELQNEIINRTEQKV